MKAGSPLVALRGRTTANSPRGHTLWEQDATMASSRQQQLPGALLGLYTLVMVISPEYFPKNTAVNPSTITFQR